MSKLSKCDKNDCRWKQRRCMLQAEEMCDSCKRFDKYSHHYWYEKNIVTTGKCSLLLELPPSHPPSPFSSPPLKRINRNRSVVERFTNTDKLKKSYNKQGLENRRRKKGRAQMRQVLGKLTNTINQAASSVQGQNMIAKTISKMRQPNLSTGGISKSSTNKSKKTADALISGLQDLLQFPTLNQHFQQKQASKQSSNTTTEATCLLPSPNQTSTASATHPRNGLSTNSSIHPQGNLSTNSMSHQSPPTVPTTVTLCQPCATSEQQSVKELHRRAKVVEIKEELGSFQIKRLQTMKSASLRRPVLSCLRIIERDEDAERCFSKDNVEDALGCKISHDEWQKIGIHARYPGPYVPVDRKKSFKNRVDSSVLLKLLHFLDSPGNLQKYAFGTQVLQLLDGSQSVTAACVHRHQKLETLSIKFIRALSDEMAGIASEVLPESNDRCQQLEERTLRRCIKHRGHGGKCAYSHKAVSPISLTTAKKLISALTAGEVKNLTGLDDIKVFKGRENFKKQRQLVEKFFEVGPEKYQMLKDIDEVEMFYVTDFIPHLQRESEFKCNCLTCGFKDASEYIVISVLFY